MRQLGGFRSGSSGKDSQGLHRYRRARNGSNGAFGYDKHGTEAEELAALVGIATDRKGGERQNWRVRVERE